MNILTKLNKGPNHIKYRLETDRGMFHNISKLRNGFAA